MLGGEVVDLGLIYQREKVLARMAFKKFEGRHEIECPRGVNYFYCVSGDLKAENIQAKVGDTLKVIGIKNISVECSSSAKYFHIHIEEI